MPKEKFTYRDFITRKVRYTRMPFLGWTTGGPINVVGAVFGTDKTLLFVPRYLLTKETVERLDEESVIPCNED
jgi:hypothetical protein